MRFVLLISVLSTGVCAAQTPAVCPWFSTGSAADVLGGPVVLSAHVVEDNSQGTCHFVLASGGQNEALDIAIGQEDTHACPQNSTKLAAVGNEAAQCRKRNAQGQVLDVIAGRVREMFFVVSMANVAGAAQAPTPPGRPPDPYAASLLERVAEQVAGSLY